MKKLIPLSACLLFVLSFSINVHAQFRDAQTAAITDTVSTLNVSAEYLLSPFSQSLNPVENFSIGGSGNQPIQLGNVTKFLLQGGVNLLRGGSDNVPLYSFENAWTYPGPTVRYPETASEYEGFLQRYDQFNADSQ